MNIPTENELQRLQEMIIYWKEISLRDPNARNIAQAAELRHTIELLGPAKILQIITVYVEAKTVSDVS